MHCIGSMYNLQNVCLFVKLRSGDPDQFYESWDCCSENVSTDHSRLRIGYQAYLLVQSITLHSGGDLFTFLHHGLLDGDDDGVLLCFALNFGQVKYSCHGTRSRFRGSNALYISSDYRE